jgi:hypothetical protein
MLPVYKAVSYQGLMSGGSTKPWAVLVEKNYVAKPFVAKLYPNKNVSEYYFIAKDVYTSVLAKQFGIKTPPPALIEFSPHFLNNLHILQKKALIGKHHSPTFGTELIEGCFPYQEDLHKDYLWKYDIETIYAFDNLVKNADRKPAKPNILIKGQELIVIDHEQTFMVRNAIEKFNENIWVYWKENHIFYKFLKERGVETKRQFFQNFLQLLITVNFDILDPYHQQLLALGLDEPLHYYELKEYLCYMQKNAAKLVQILKGELG